MSKEKVKVIERALARTGEAFEAIDGPPPKAEVAALANHALNLIGLRLSGNVELARRTWTAAFELAERLEYNMLCEPDELD